MSKASSARAALFLSFCLSQPRSILPRRLEAKRPGERYRGGHRTVNSSCILVVDDNATNLKLVAHVLEFDGYRILKAHDAEEAQEILSSALPDLILMDIALPGM